MPYFTPSDAPLYEIKANLFKALAHPARVRILEMLVATEGPCPVSEILEALEIEASLLSQHLSVLKRHNVVTSTRMGNTVTYQLAHPQVAGLLQVARAFLVDRLATQQQQLALAAQLDSRSHVHRSAQERARTAVPDLSTVPAP